MSQSTALQPIEETDRNQIMERVIVQGDLSALTPEQRVSYYNNVCRSLNLNPLTKPFDYIVLDGKLILYARKDATEQLRKLNGISIWKTESSENEKTGLLTVTAYARTPDGREDIDEGVVFIKGFMGPQAANLRMKAITKAKRRVTLSICGLGFLDESEIDSIPGARKFEDEEAVMTEREAERLTIAHKASGLDQWACGRALAMNIIGLSTTLKAMKIGDDVIKSWLPSGVTSRKDLTEDQANDFIYALERRIDLFNLCGQLADRGVDQETMRMKLPYGVQSLKDLSLPQVEEAIKNFTHWRNAYNEVVEGGVING